LAAGALIAPREAALRLRGGLPSGTQRTGAGALLPDGVVPPTPVVVLAGGPPGV